MIIFVIKIIKNKQIFDLPLFERKYLIFYPTDAIEFLFTAKTIHKCSMIFELRYIKMSLIIYQIKDNYITEITKN